MTIVGPHVSGPLAASSTETFYLTIQRPACPSCGAVEVGGKIALAAHGSKRDGDGARLRYCRCRLCGAHVVLIVEAQDSFHFLE